MARYAERQHHPERLTRPLLRTGAKGEGAFRPISWDEALDRVADAFRNAADRFGPEAVWPYLYAGTMGLVQRDGIERLRAVMGYSGMHRTICSTIAKAGWKAGAGALRGVDPREMPEADLVVLWGCNAAATQVHVMTHATMARKDRGAPLVVVDPYANATARAADMHLALRPGTDGALACAVMHVLFAEGFADRDYLARYTDAPERLEGHVRSLEPEWAAAITGLDAEEIVAFARLYGSTPRSFLRLGYGFTRARNGAAAMHAASCLPAVTGAWRHRGGGALFSNGDLYPINRTLIEGLDAHRPGVRELDMSRIGPVLTGDPRDLGDGPPVTAMIVQNTNPAAVAPESVKVREGLALEDLFLCVHEQFLTETAAFADIVLPATTFLEHDDIYVGGGHTFLQVARPVVDAPGECRSNHAVICDLAARLGAEHPGFAMTARELIDATLAASGLPDSEAIVAGGGHDCAIPFEEAHYQNGFAWPDGRFRFAPDWLALGPAGIDAAAAARPRGDHRDRGRGPSVPAGDRAGPRPSSTRASPRPRRRAAGSGGRRPSSTPTTARAPASRPAIPCASATPAAPSSSTPSLSPACSRASWSSKASGRTRASSRASASTPWSAPKRSRRRAAPPSTIRPSGCAARTHEHPGAPPPSPKRKRDHDHRPSPLRRGQGRRRLLRALRRRLQSGRRRAAGARAARLESRDEGGDRRGGGGVPGMGGDAAAVPRPRAIPFQGVDGGALRRAGEPSHHRAR